jgi:hypothetical protein
LSQRARAAFQPQAWHQQRRSRGGCGNQRLLAAREAGAQCDDQFRRQALAQQLATQVDAAEFRQACRAGRAARWRQRWRPTSTFASVSSAGSPTDDQNAERLGADHGEVARR